MNPLEQLESILFTNLCCNRKNCATIQTSTTTFFIGKTDMITAEQVRELAGPTVQERVDAVYPMIVDAASTKTPSCQ